MDICLLEGHEERLTSIDFDLQGIKRDMLLMDGQTSMLKNIKTVPKVSVPTFDGKVLSWKSFCEQFDATIHSKAGLNETDKLMHFQDALKDGPARFVIEGLTQTSKIYEEAIKCLKEWYNCPHLVEEEHIHSIVDVVPIKNGSNKELCRFYDAETPHCRALEAAKNK